MPLPPVAIPGRGQRFKAAQGLLLRSVLLEKIVHRPRLTLIIDRDDVRNAVSLPGLVSGLQELP